MSSRLVSVEVPSVEEVPSAKTASAASAATEQADRNLRHDLRQEEMNNKETKKETKKRKELPSSEEWARSEGSPTLESLPQDAVRTVLEKGVGPREFFLLWTGFRSNANASVLREFLIGKLREEAKLMEEYRGRNRVAVPRVAGGLAPFHSFFCDFGRDSSRLADPEARRNMRCDLWRGFVNFQGGTLLGLARIVGDAAPVLGTEYGRGQRAAANLLNHAARSDLFALSPPDPAGERRLELHSTAVFARRGVTVYIARTTQTDDELWALEGSLRAWFDAGDNGGAITLEVRNRDWLLENKVPLFGAQNKADPSSVLFSRHGLSLRAAFDPEHEVRLKSFPDPLRNIEVIFEQNMDLEQFLDFWRAGFEGIVGHGATPEA